MEKFHPIDIQPSDINFVWSLPSQEQNGIIRKFSITYGLEVRPLFKHAWKFVYNFKKYAKRIRKADEVVFISSRIEEYVGASNYILSRDPI